MAADYSMDYAEIGKQHSALTSQMEALSKALDGMVNIEETLLSSAQWNAEDKQELTSRFDAYVNGGRNLHKTGVNQANTLQQVSNRYHQAEQG